MIYVGASAVIVQSMLSGSAGIAAHGRSQYDRREISAIDADDRIL
jgi:hypothetical protein